MYLTYLVFLDGRFKLDGAEITDVGNAVILSMRIATQTLESGVYELVDPSQAQLGKFTLGIVLHDFDVDAQIGTLNGFIRIRQCREIWWELYCEFDSLNISSFSSSSIS
jgi:hypothetical protein